MISTSIYTYGQAGRIEIKIAKLEWQAADANVMVVVNDHWSWGKRYWSALTNLAWARQLLRDLEINKTKVFSRISSSSVFAKDFWQILKRKRSHVRTTLLCIITSGVS